LIKKSRIALILAVSAAVLALLSSSPVFAQDCPTGYVWSRRSISCIQENCNEIPDAHYSYVLDCICGSSGSINEKPTDPNKECSYPHDYASCPGCTYACVHLDEPCPGEEVATTITAQPVTTIKSTTPSTTILDEDELCNKEWEDEANHVKGTIDDFGECVGICELGWEMRSEGCKSCDEICNEDEPGTRFSKEDSKENSCVCSETEETEQEKMARAIAQNFVDYLGIKNEFLKGLKDLQIDADYILQQIRDAEWDLEHGTKEDKEQAESDLERLYGEQDRILAEFESRSVKLYDMLKRMEGGFADYEHRDEYEDFIDALEGELDMAHLNLALRLGDMEEFDLIFPDVNGNPHVRNQALTANVFRQLMEGDTRTALHSARLVLEEDPENPIAQQLVRNIELTYMKRIRDQLALEQSSTARLLNDKLNSHGQQGLGNLLIDIATTGVGESFSAIAGYYDTLGDLQDIQVDEASRQIAGIRLIENLRERGVTFEEMNQLSIDEMKKLAREQYGRELNDEQAQNLRQRIWDGFRNVDVDAIRSGDLSQYNIDVGRDYFDSEILQFNEADLVNRQFSAWDTFLTFAPSAHLGRLAETGLAGRLGLTAQSTFQQGLQAGFRVEQLGQSIYQTRTGAAIIDGLHQLNGYETMVANAIKNRVGDTVYAAGSAAVRQYIAQMTGPAKKRMQEEILRISDHFLGAETTGAIEGTMNAMSGIFNFIGLNQQALMRGAYGVERMERLERVIQSESASESNSANNLGVVRAGTRPRNFNEFKRSVEGNDDYLEEVRDARSRVSSITQDSNTRRRSLLSQADQTLQHEQQAAQLLRSGDDAGARQAFNQMVQSQNQLSQARGESLRRLGELNNRLTLINEFRATPPGDKEFAGAMAGYISGQAAGQSSSEGTQVTSNRDLLGIAQSALLENVPQ